jgi:formate hydrogenlyase subunit 3/multisubunit Na+/H+ antiporter MnhD subunit
MSLGVKGGGTGIVMYVIGWLGLLTAFFGALLAIFQEDLKRMLAYSSMGQVGYIIAALATGTHLGWVAGGYLAVNHLLFKGLLFLVAAGVILRVGQREMYKMGGLIQNMPMSFVGMLVGIVALSGVPPLTGFGGKWLLLNALLEKGWYWQAGLAFFASAVAFLYLFRMIHTVFLGQRKRAHRDLREAPLALLIPQALLIAIILAISIQPNWLVGPLAAIMAGELPQTLVVHGSLVQSGLGYWDGFLIINVVGAVFVISLLMLLVLARFMRVQRVKQFNIVFAAERPETPETTHYAYDFYRFYERALGFLIVPRATAFWNGVSEWSHSLGGGLRSFYTGNGQTYALYVLLYVVTLYLAVGGNA